MMYVFIYLQIHDIIKTALTTLDQTVDQYLKKKWSDLDKRAYDAVLHPQFDIGIKSVTHLSRENVMPWLMPHQS